MKNTRQIAIAAVVICCVLVGCSSNRTEEKVVVETKVDESRPTVSVNLLSLADVTEEPEEPEEINSIYNISSDYNDFVNNFDNWYTRASTVSIDVVHNIKSDGSNVTFTEAHTQLDNRTSQAHLTSYKPNYMLDMWWNTNNDDRILSVTTDTEVTNWVALDGTESQELYEFVGSHSTYTKSLQSVKSYLDFMNSLIQFDCTSGFTSYVDKDMDSYTIKYSSEDFSIENTNPTFLNENNLLNWTVSFQKIADTVYLVATYNYTESSSVQSESYCYCISTDSTCSLERPSVLTEKVGTIDNLEKIYKEVKGD